MPKVLNRKVDKISREAVYVGRPSMWGNPFVVGQDGTREEVVEMYKRKIFRSPSTIEMIKRNLKGKNLVCWCAPLPCHADVLLEIANG